MRQLRLLFTIELITDTCYYVLADNSPVIYAQSAIYALVSVLIGVFYSITIFRIIRKLSSLSKLRSRDNAVLQITTKAGVIALCHLGFFCCTVTAATDVFFMVSGWYGVNIAIAVFFNTKARLNVLVVASSRPATSHKSTTVALAPKSPASPIRAVKSRRIDQVHLVYNRREDPSPVDRTLPRRLAFGAGLQLLGKKRRRRHFSPQDSEKCSKASREHLSAPVGAQAPRVTNSWNSFPFSAFLAEEACICE